MILRLAGEADRRRINALARQVHELHVSWRPDIYRSIEEYYNEKGFAKFFAEETLFVAELDGETAGYLRCSLRNLDHRLLLPRKVLYVEELCVDARFRHQGIGKQMMTDLQEIARGRGCTDIELSALPQNAAAVSLYESLGFTAQRIDYQLKL